MSEQFGSETKSMREEAMAGVITQAEGIAKAGEKTFEDAFLSILESDGYTAGMNPELANALKKRDIQKLIAMAHSDGWL